MPKVRLKPSRSQLQNFVQATADSKHTLPAQLAKWHEAQDLRNQQLFRHEVVSEELCSTQKINKPHLQSLIFALQMKP